MKKQQPVELSALAFDALHVGSLAVGGIGRGAMYDHNVPWEKAEQGGVSYYGAMPLCAAGILEAMQMPHAFPTFEKTSRWVGGESDRAVARINRRRGKPRDTRVPFELWALEMNVHIIPEGIYNAE